MIDLGADTDAVRVHAEAMRAGTSTLRGRLSSLGTTVRAVDWHGADAESFRATAESLFSEAETVLEGIAAAMSSSSTLMSRTRPHRPTGREARPAAPRDPAVMRRGR